MILMADNIGEPLKLFRAKVGLTQEEMAARLGIDRGRYAQWEAGRSMPALEFRMALSDMGMNALPGVKEHRAIYDPDNSGVLRILIDTIYDCDSDGDRRAQARRELYRLLKIPDVKN